jgi:hypothetical protein
VNPWADVDALKAMLIERSGSGLKSRSLESVFHVRHRTACYRYRTRRGEVRVWHQSQLGHAHSWNRVSVFGLCSEMRGPLPAIIGGTANRLTAIFTKVTCGDCRALLDREMEAGRVAINQDTMKLEFDATVEPAPRQHGPGCWCLACEADRP